MTVPRIRKKLQNFQGVSPGGTATCDLPLGRWYHGLKIIYRRSGVLATVEEMLADIALIELEINGKVQRSMTARQLFAINAYHGYLPEPGEIMIYLSEPWRSNSIERESLGWGTGEGVSTFQIKVTLNNSATAPSIEGRCEYDPSPAPIGQIVKWKSFGVPVTGAGVVNYTQLPRREAVYAMHAFAANVTAVKVEHDGAEIYNLDRVLAQSFSKDNAKNIVLDPVTGKPRVQVGFNGLSIPIYVDLFPITFDDTGQNTDFLLLKGRIGDVDYQSFEFTQTFDVNAGGDFQLLVQTLGLPD